MVAAAIATASALENPPTAPANDLLTRAWAALEAVPDPEIPVVSIRELGILRSIAEQDGQLVVTITPTYTGCPAIDQIEQDIVSALSAIGLTATVRTALAPAWTTDWMGEVAKAKLRQYGVAPPVGNAAMLSNAQAQQPVRFARRAVTAVDAPVPCPLCASTNTTETSHFGSTACKALYKCLNCLEPFDYFKPY